MSDMFNNPQENPNGDPTLEESIQKGMEVGFGQVIIKIATNDLFKKHTPDELSTIYVAGMNSFASSLDHAVITEQIKTVREDGPEALDLPDSLRENPDDSITAQSFIVGDMTVAFGQVVISEISLAALWKRVPADVLAKALVTEMIKYTSSLDPIGVAKEIVTIRHAESGMTGKEEA